MVDISKLIDLEKALGVDPGTEKLLPAREALANTTVAKPSEVKQRLDVYLAELAVAYNKKSEKRDEGFEERLTDLVVEPVGFLAQLAKAAKPLVIESRRARQDLNCRIPVGPVTIDLGAPVVSVPGQPVVAHLPIDSLAMVIGAGELKASGTGYLRPEAQSAGGLLAANLGVVELTVVALLQNADPVSVLALLRADFLPAGIQLGLGFSLDAVGGLFGLNRTAHVDQIRDGLNDGSAMEALFGGTTASTAAIKQTLEALERMFPRADGKVVVGPTMRLGWLKVAGTPLLRLDVGVILVLPYGRVVLPGRAVLEVPGPGIPLVHLRADLLGEVDVPGKRLSVDAALVNSQVLGVFRVGGTAAAFVTWSEPAVVVMTVGGFYPGFDPRPAQIPPQRRITIDLTSPLPGLRLSAEGYVAATTGTLQFGGRISAGYDIGIAGIYGSVSGDALIQLSPLWFTATLSGSVTIRALGEDLAGITCRATVTGPGPMSVSLTARVKILWTRVGGTKDFVLSRSSGADLSLADNLRSVVERELREGDNVTSDGGSDPFVQLDVAATDSKHPLICPVGAVLWRQYQFPLDSPVEKADGRILAAPAIVTFESTGSRIRERLATSSFVNLSDSKALTVAPYEPHDVGIRIPVVTTEADNPTFQTSQYDTFIVSPKGAQSPQGGITWPSKYLDTVGIAAAMQASTAPPTLMAGPGARATSVAEERWCAVGDLPKSTSAAMTAAAAVATARFDPTRVAMPQAALLEVAI